MPKRIDMLGKTFNRLTVIGPAEGMAHGHAVWRCSCQCGNPEPVFVVGNNLRQGRTKSCGCLLREHSARIGRLSKGRVRSPYRALIRTMSNGGKTAKEIAETLGMHIVTVYKNRTAIRRAATETLTLLS